MAVGRGATRSDTGRLRRAVGHSIAVGDQRATSRANNRVLQVRRAVSESNCVTGSLLVLERVLLNSAVELAKVVNARIFLRGGASFNEVGNRDRSEQADDGHHNHNFHQGEARLICVSDFHLCLSFCGGVNRAAGGLYYCNCCSLIAGCNRNACLSS